MKVNRKLLLSGVGTFLLIIAIFAYAMFPQLCPSSFGYFDIKSGKRKFEWKYLGLTYKVRIVETDYSKMLNELGVSSLDSQWRITSETRNRLFGKEYWDYEYGRIAHDAERFAEVLETTNSTKLIKAEEIRHFRDLVAKGDSEEVRQYLAHIQASEGRQ